MGGKKWAEEDLERFVEDYQKGGPILVCGWLPHRTRKAIIAKAHKLKILAPPQMRGPVVKSLAGQMYGESLILRRGKDHIGPTGRKRVRWECLCLLCGKVFIARTDVLKRGDIISCGCYCRKRSSEANSGEKSHLWKGGITPLSDAIRASTKYKEWHKQVFKRDWFICQKCGAKSSSKISLNAHHKKPLCQIRDENNISSLKEALECKEFWSVGNGITLCEDCHQKGKRGFHRLCGPSGSEELFNNWLERKE